LLFSDKFGYEYASQLLVASDVSDNNALDWAADAGEVNIIEYLIRRNINPLRTNYNGRTALHIAAKYNRLEAARFLVKCGCDPFQLSRDSESPMSIAVASNNREIIDAMTWKNNLGKLRLMQLSKFSSNTKTRMRAASRDFGSLVGIAGENETNGQAELESGNLNPERKNTQVGASPPGATYAVIGNEATAPPATAATAMSSPSLLRDPDPGLSLFTVNKQGARIPHAIFRLKPSRIGYALFYGVVVVGYWILAICVSFYVWAIFVVLSVLLFRCEATPATLPISPCCMPCKILY
jgi:Ankyrin repeats (3 copies)